MAITVLDCALGVKAVYKNENFEDFQLKQGFYDPKNMAVGDSGYSVGVYKYLPDPDTYLISMRGSGKSFTTKDWVDDDVSIGVGRTPDRTGDSLDYTRKIQRLYIETYGNPLFILAGHSLGGWLAQYVGVVLNMPFITFNAPPALGTFGGKLPDGTRVGNFKQGLNFRVNYDPVSKAPGKHVGPLITLPLCGQKHLAAHKAGSVVQSLSQTSYAERTAMGQIGLSNA